MPIYDYECRACALVFQAKVHVQDRQEPIHCVSCGEKAERTYRSVPNMIVKGESKNRAFKEYEPRFRVPVPAWAQREGHDPKSYEAAAGRLWAEQEQMALEIKRERMRSGTPEGALRKVGSITFTEYLAMKNKYSDEMGDGSPPTREILEREGAIYKHEKGGKK